MEEIEKYNLHLAELKKLKKSKIGVKELINIINISRTTFQNIIKENNLYLLPNFSTKEYKRKDGSPYNIYVFDIYDTAKFLAEN